LKIAIFTKKITCKNLQKNLQNGKTQRNRIWPAKLPGRKLKILDL